MKEKYVHPESELICFEQADIITTSPDPVPEDKETPIVGFDSGSD